MMFVKPRKFCKLIQGNWHGSHMFEALDIHHISYELSWIKNENVAVTAELTAIIKGWNPATLLVMSVKSPDIHILMVCDNLTLEHLAKITNQIVRMRAFL